MINGTEYAYEDVRIVLFGVLLTGVTSISYGVDRAYTNISGVGNRPIKRGRGGKTAQNTVVRVLQSEFEALQRKMPAGTDITDAAPTNITVSYAPLGGVITTDSIPYAQCSSFTKAISTDDDHMEVELTFVTDIPKFNI